jgi:glucokinase
MSQRKFYLCLDIGGTKILGTVFDENNSLVFEIKIKTGAENGCEFVENNIFDVISKLLQFVNFYGTAVFVAMGVPGLIDSKKGEILFAPNIYFENYPLKQKVEEKYKIPCFVGNDVNLGLLGEWKYGNINKPQNCVGIFVGTGIGGSIIINDILYKGNSYCAGEFGHIVVEKDGPKCSCGNNGCIEAFAGKSAITAYVREQIVKGRKTMLKESLNKDVLIGGNALRKALIFEDEVAMEVMDRAALYLARGAAILINIFNPETIVFGGGIIEATGDYVMPRVIKQTPNYCIKEIYKNTKIIKADLGDYSVVYGAKALGEDEWQCN